MATSIKINTDSVVNAAANIKTINGQIRDRFPDVQTAMNRLDGSWDGSAATSAMRKFNEIKNNYPSARYTVLDNYVNFLLQQVGQGYNETEEVNKSLADAFK